MKSIFLVFLSLALILEAGLTTIPLLLIVLNCYVVISKKTDVFLYALVFGIILDILTFKTLGTEALFFIIFLFLILLYKRKFEIETPSFILISSFFGSLAFLFIFYFNNFIFFQAAVSAIFSLLIFIIFKNMYKSKISESKYG